MYNKLPYLRKKHKIIQNMRIDNALIDNLNRIEGQEPEQRKCP